MPKYEFTSNIKCENCEATVRKVLDGKNGIENFQVDLSNKERPVSITADQNVSEKDVIQWVRESGFELKPKGSFLKKLFK